MKHSIHRTSGGLRGRKALYPGPAVAGVLYIAFAIYLYQPYFERFETIRYMLLVNSVAGSLGCYLLSRRWISSFWGKLFAGALYGFSPFALGFAAFHPLGGLPLAALPWLFCPAAFWATRHRGSPNTLAQKVIVAALSLLPFVVIGLFFWLCAQPGIGPFFPLPKHAKLQLADIAGLAAPLTLKPHDFIFGFYHVPVAVGLMGLLMYFAAGRLGIMIIAAAGLCLAFCDSFFGVSPIVWGLVPALFCSILIGLGTQALAWAGKADRKWILLCTATAAALAIGTLLPAITGKLPDPGLTEAAKLHGLAAVIMAIIFFISKAGMRLHLLRWIILCAALGLDLVLGARYIVDKIF